MSDRILCISRNYPNPVIERLGIWAERLVLSCAGEFKFTVIAPVPYSPPLPGLPQYTRFRRIPHREVRSGIDLYHPRFLTAPGYWLHSYELTPYYWALRRLVDRLHADRPFDLIHAHFAYPDGCAAATLAQRYDIPFLITEHADWHQQFDRAPRLRRQAVDAASASTFVIAVSQSLRRSIQDFVGQPANCVVVPNVVDGSIFRLLPGTTQPPGDRLLFVGIMRQVKGLDVLLRALRILRDRGHILRLAIVGESFYQGYQRDHRALRTLVQELAVADQVDFLGGKPPDLVAEEIRRSTMLVLPSRRETFGTVLVEALACGIPVVATRCGGPEDIVTDEVGVLVEPESAEALALGIVAVLRRRNRFVPEVLSAYALEQFGPSTVGRLQADLYRQAIDARRARPSSADA